MQDLTKSSRKKNARGPPDAKCLTRRAALGNIILLESHCEREEYRQHRHAERDGHRLKAVLRRQRGRCAREWEG